jgi:antitoxin (DNA-binding transcriptional repressor) of toxin-antitoxin stability system
MRSVGIKVLKNRLSEYIRLASQGETILVTDRDRVVAEITEPQAGRGDVASDAVLAEAMRKGLITPPILRQTDMPRQPVASLGEILDELAAARQDRCGPRRGQAIVQLRGQASVRMSTDEILALTRK